MKLPVEFLEGVAIRLAAVDVLHEGDDGHRGLQGLGQPGDKQCGGGAVLRGDYAGAPGNARIPIRHRSPGVLGTIGVATQPQIPTGQQYRRRQALGEQYIHPMADQGRCNCLGYTSSLRHLENPPDHASPLLASANRYIIRTYELQWQALS